MGIPNQERLVMDLVPEKLRKQLAVAVRSIQWSYAIFWSLSSSQQGVLEWKNGYYNGDIRTRKTVQSAEVNASDKLSLHRSQQLRELYESLKEGESDLGTNKKPSAALSPEDLTDLEWYYMVCMSYTYKSGKGLPRRALISGQSIWLCNAQNADSRVFCRSLLAKSAALQTVICFPYIGGVIELGTTDLVEEDPTLIQRVKTSLLDVTKPVCTEKSFCSQRSEDHDKDQFGVNVNHDIVNTSMDFTALCPNVEQIRLDYEMVNELNMSISEDFINLGSPDDCSNDCCANNNQADDSFMMEEENNVPAPASPVQSWYLMDDDLSQCIQDSFNSTGCVSQSFANHQKTVEKVDGKHVQKIQDCNDTKFSFLDLGADADDEDLHFKRTLSLILNTSPRSLGNYTYIPGRKSSFETWNSESGTERYRPPSPQKTLKKVLFMTWITPQKTLKGGGKDRPLLASNAPKLSGVPAGMEEDDKHLGLRSILPSIDKIAKTRILDEGIEYLQEIAARVEELKSCINLAESAHETRRRYTDMMERTSDNYENKRTDDGKKPWVNKRKACDIDETEPDLSKVIPADNTLLDMKVSIGEHEVQIDLRCPWREYLLLDIMEAINNLSLDTHRVQSSTVDGILIVTLKSKFRGAALASAGVIKQALRRTVGIC